MCSICGIVDFIHEERANEGCVRKMGEALAHRGPDQQGVYVAKGVAFQHNRLAIMDVERGLQPMTRVYEGRKYTIVYNGEIYNTPELTKMIEKAGVKLQTTCDTEVVLYLYILLKEQCASYLNGIFAFAVWDESKHEVYLARDRFGIKPFFYTQVGSTLLFASEVKGLLAHDMVKSVLDQEGLWQLLYLAPTKIGGTSVFKDILEIPTGYYGVYNKSGLKLTKYWELEAKAFEGTEQDAVEETKRLVTDAITRQLVSDVPLATLLSGGLDSSIISSVAARKYAAEGRQLGTYSFEYAGNKENFHATLFQPQSDDEYARYLAHELGTHHQVLTADIDSLIKLLYDATLYRDLPGMADIDSSLLYYCSQVKKEHTVVLSGECADEIFGGYPWFYRPEMLQSGFFPWIHDATKRASLFQDKWVKPDEGLAFAQSIYQKSVAECPVLDSDNASMRQSRIATCLSVQYFMTSLLERKDRMSMASGVEVRVPFADHRILEFIYNVPWEIKFKNQVEKALLREAMQDYLPDKILNRKKSPYPKTHNPAYEAKVIKLLEARLNDSDCRIKELINKVALEDILATQNVTWFGQLMSKPQLLAWLLQLDYWLVNYNVDIQL